jgi:tRNA nucleotidyltransferase/poly(A) polymerase
MKCKLLGIIDFISELIKVKMISQKMGLEYLDNLKKRINSFDEDIKNYNDIDINLKNDIKNLYYEGELLLIKKLSVIIQERKKPKHIQNLKNFIEDNIIPINNNKTLNQNLANEFLLFLNDIKNNDFFKDIQIINEKQT